MDDVPNRPDKSIVLVGLMGVGKSTVGRRLAKKLKMKFVDADEEIERAAGMKIAEIFDRHGEGQFRDGERRVIARLVAGPPRVIATGGGAFINEETRRLILERCIAVWLDAEIEILAARVSRGRDRPLLRGQDPLAVLASLAERRNPIYAEAHLIVRSATGPHDEVVERIVAGLAESGALPTSATSQDRGRPEDCPG
jgi:shikimate kinase